MDKEETLLRFGKRKLMNSQKEDRGSEAKQKGANYYSQERLEMLPFIPEDANAVLDVGCGEGGFGSRLKAKSDNCKVCGIEPNPDAAKIAESRLDQVYCGTFEEAIHQMDDKTFDCIVFNDVLEHFPNPDLILRDCLRILRPNGLVVASIPNILYFYQIWEILIEQDFRYKDDGILDNTHLRFFTKKSLRRMFEMNGFQIVDIVGINPGYGLKFTLANLLTFGRIADWKYLQFAVQARKAA
jgi:2-polyprenyl-3-methyl-5-hydroxy-6-metoxy-1,4-benzoquinol methylase